MKRVFLLEGNLLERQSILRKIDKLMGDCEHISFDKGFRIDYVVQVITEFNCFDENRLFIVRELPSTKGKIKDRTKVIAELKKSLKSVPSGNVVVFNNIGVTAKSFLDEVGKYGKIYLYDSDLEVTKARKKIIKYFESQNKTISYDNAGNIAEFLASSSKKVSIDCLDLFLIKLDNFLGAKNNVSKEDIYIVGSTSKDFIIWNLYTILDNKDFCNAFKILSDYLFLMKDIHRGLESILNQLIWKYDLLLLVKQCQYDKVVAKDEIAKIVKLERSGKSQKIRMFADSVNAKTPRYSSKMINSVITGYYSNKASISCYTLDNLILINYTLMKSLIKIRAGCTTAETKMILQFILMVICGKITKKKTLAVLETKEIHNRLKQCQI